MAATLDFDLGGDVIAVRSISVGGSFYDATWAQGSFNSVGQQPVVLNNQADATTVVNTIFGLFNGAGITASQIGNVSCNNSNDCDLVVAYNLNATNFDAVNVDWDTNPPDWDAQNQSWTRTFVSPLVAQVTLTAVNPVPLPGGIPLLASGLLGFAALKRRKSRKKG